MKRAGAQSPGTNTFTVFNLPMRSLRTSSTGQMKLPAAPLLRPGLEDNLVVTHRFGDDPPFVNRQRQRLFPVHILLRFGRRQIDQGVPMIRGRMDDGMDVIPRHDLAEIVEFVRRLALARELSRRTSDA